MPKSEEAMAERLASLKAELAPELEVIRLLGTGRMAEVFLARQVIQAKVKLQAKDPPVGFGSYVIIQFLFVEFTVICPGFIFVQLLKAENDWHYVGKNVKLGDSESPVCWYRPDSSETYRVIFGDLSVKDVAPENLPK